MNYEYSPAKNRRLLEILPGLTSWSVITGMAALSVVRPMLAAMIIIMFILYWLLKIIYMHIFLVASYMRLAREKNTRWMERIKDAPDIFHLVILPVLKETKEVVEPGIKAIAGSDFPLNRLLVIIALEERAADNVKKDIAELQGRYKDKFLCLMTAVHPADMENEARVKGANVTYAAKQAAEYFSQHNIPYENVLVSCFDADTVPAVNYFSCLTYHFITTADRFRASYQPVPVYHNNIWDVPAFARIIDIGTSFFQLIEATNPRKLVTFSSHSMSFKTLVEVGYWPVDMISDDSAIFWKSFIHFDGRYHVVPIYTTVSMDIATGPTIRQTFLNIYKQKRRWAWGVENFPVVIRAFLKSKTISLYKKITYGYKLFDAFVSWGTWSFLLLAISIFPAFFIGRDFATTTVYYTIPRIRSTIFSLASIGLVICMLISLVLLPKKNIRYNIIVKLRHALEWFLIPVVVIFLSALPALDAQTRLMLGRHMEFWVADKHRKKK